MQCFENLGKANGPLGCEPEF